MEKSHDPKARAVSFMSISTCTVYRGWTGQFAYYRMPADTIRTSVCLIISREAEMLPFSDVPWRRTWWMLKTRSPITKWKLSYTLYSLYPFLESSIHGDLAIFSMSFLSSFGPLFPYFIPPFSPSLSFLPSTQVSEFPISNSSKLLVE